MDARNCLIGFVSVVTLANAGCDLGSLGRDFSPVPADASAATPAVAGTYDWIADVQGENPGTGFGTIAFEQAGTLVTVIDTTHGNPADRDLTGSATFDGNVLVMQMVPRNGDTDYSADITFRFTADGDRFEVEFTDTNDDFGPAFGFRRVGE